LTKGEGGRLARKKGHGETDLGNREEAMVKAIRGGRI